MDFVAKTDVGLKRKNNEDSYFAKKYSKDISICIVADGLGGYEGGEVASNILVTKMSEYFESNINEKLNEEKYVKDVLIDALNIANLEIYKLEKTDVKYKGMGTTVSLVAIIYGKIYYLSVGDSRIYYTDKNMLDLIQVTEDDTYVNTLIKTNVINKEEADNHPQKHVLTKAVGIFENIETIVHILEKDSGYIMLCTDGITNMLSNKETLQILRKNKFENLAEKLISKANENGGLDNSTAIVIKL